MPVSPLWTSMFKAFGSASRMGPGDSDAVTKIVNGQRDTFINPFASFKVQESSR